MSLIEARIFLEFSSFGSSSTAFVKYSFACLKSLSAFAFSALYLSGSEVAIGVAAVSYTHLDVYKRQEQTILPDMIEVGSFIGMAAMTGSEITIKNTGYDKLGIIPDAFRRLGITVEQRGDDIYIPRHDSYEIDTFIDLSLIHI